MTFSEIKTFTYMGSTVSIDGRDFEIPTKLDPTVEAVQYHKGRDYLLEEIDGDNVEVVFDKYQYALDEWYDVKELNDNPPAPTTEEQIKLDLWNKISDYKSYLDSTDFKMLADYPKDVTEVIKLRKEARDYIYENEIKGI